jgi:iron complex transport system substrate-binding protein
MLIFTSLNPVHASGFPLNSTDPIITNSVEYLESIQSIDGSIGSYSDTAWAIMAIAATGANPDTWGKASAVSYLSNNASQLENSYNLTADLARNILAIVASGKDPYSFGAENTIVPKADYVLALSETYDGRQFGVADSINEDCWAIMALISAGYSVNDEMIQNAAAYIRENQVPDGGWSWATPSNEMFYESQADDTAAAIMALVAAGEDLDTPAIQKGLQYLKQSQNESGGFSAYGVENSSSTAWVICALSSLGFDLDEWSEGKVIRFHSCLKCKTRKVLFLWHLLYRKAIGLCWKKQQRIAS